MTDALERFWSMQSTGGLLKRGGHQSATDHQEALAKAYVEGMRAGYGYGFSASGQGYNAEYPFQDQNSEPENDKRWAHDRDVMLANKPNKYEVKK